MVPSLFPFHTRSLPFSQFSTVSDNMIDDGVSARLIRSARVGRTPLAYG